MSALILAAQAASTDPVGAAWITAASALAVAVAGGVAFAGRQAWRVLSRVIRFLDDWAGEPERPGVPARPGVMARLGTAEALIAKVAAETRPNGGSSLRDVLQQAAKDISDVKTEQSSMRDRMELFERQRHTRERGTA